MLMSGRKGQARVYGPSVCLGKSKTFAAKGPVYLLSLMAETAIETTILESLISLTVKATPPKYSSHESGYC